VNHCSITCCRITAAEEAQEENKRFNSANVYITLEPKKYTEVACRSKHQHSNEALWKLCYINKIGLEMANYYHVM